MDAQHLPAVIGSCAHCGLPLYEHAAVALPTAEALAHCEPHCRLAHVGCAVDATRVH